MHVGWTTAPDQMVARQNVPLRRNRDFLLLWSGEVVSTLGSQISLVAFPLLVLATTRSPARAGLVGFANQVPVLAFYLPAGLLVDRHDRRAIMVASSVLGALALGSVPVALALGDLAFGQILIVAFLAGTRQIVYSVAEQGALPLVVAPNQVSEAVARNQARLEAATLMGPPLGGVLFGAARVVPFAFDSVSYLFSALGAVLVRTPLQEPRDGRRPGALTDIGEALGWFWCQSFLRASALAVAVANFTWMALELVLIVRAREHGAAPAAVGVMVAGIGLGGLIGSLFAPALARRLSPPVVVIGLFWVEALLVPFLALTRDPYVLGVIVALVAMGGPTWNAVVVAARLTITPDRLRGRVNSAARLISGSMLALGALGGGVLAASVGTTDALLALAAVLLLLALAAIASSSLRAGLPNLRTAPSSTGEPRAA
jgi:predicted MFS family arabinose efflux permease